MFVSLRIVPFAMTQSRFSAAEMLRKNDPALALYEDHIFTQRCDSERVKDMERFGEKLRVLRERRGLSYRKLAPEIGVTYAHIAAIESGAHQPSVDLILRISVYFKVSLDQLMRDDRELRLR